MLHNHVLPTASHTSFWLFKVDFMIFQPVLRNINLFDALLHGHKSHLEGFLAFTDVSDQSKCLQKSANGCAISVTKIFSQRNHRLKVVKKQYEQRLGKAVCQPECCRLSGPFCFKMHWKLNGSIRSWLLTFFSATELQKSWMIKGLSKYLRGSKIVCRSGPASCWYILYAVLFSRSWTI